MQSELMSHNMFQYFSTKYASKCTSVHHYETSFQKNPGADTPGPPWEATGLRPDLWVTLTKGQQLVQMGQKVHI